MSAISTRTGPGALPDWARSTAWGDVTGALASLSRSISSTVYAGWERVSTLFDGAAQGKASPNLADGRYGDPVGMGDARSSPVLRSGPEPRALDQIGGNRENRAGMPDSARLVSPQLVLA